MFTESINDNESLTPEQQQALADWEREFQAWQKDQQEFDYEAENRKRALAFSIAMLITGIPVFAAHAPWVFKRAAR